VGGDKRVGIQEKRGWEVYRRWENRGQTGGSQGDRIGNFA